MSMERAVEDWDDEELAGAIRAGSREARNTFYLRHQAELLEKGRPARRLLGGIRARGRMNVTISPEDIDQQLFVVFCELVEAWQGEVGECLLLEWLDRKLPGKLMHYVRGATRYYVRGRLSETVPLFLDESGEEHYSIASCESPTDHEPEGASGNSSKNWKKHIETLPAELRETVELRWGQGLSNDEISRRTRHSHKRISRDLNKAVHVLRAELADNWDGCD